MFPSYSLLHLLGAPSRHGTGEDQEEANRRRRRRRLDRRQETDATNQRIADLEDDLGRLTLLLRSLTDLVLKKGLVTLEELLQHAAVLDATDGVVDGKMKVKKAPPAAPTAEPPDPPRPRRRPRA